MNWLNLFSNSSVRAPVATIAIIFFTILGVPDMAAQFIGEDVGIGNGDADQLYISAVGIIAIYALYIFGETAQKIWGKCCDE